jgi:hypothetical protein
MILGRNAWPAPGPEIKIQEHTNEAVRLLKTLRGDFSERGEAVRLLKTSML